MEILSNMTNTDKNERMTDTEYSHLLQGSITLMKNFDIHLLYAQV